MKQSRVYIKNVIYQYYMCFEKSEIILYNRFFFLFFSADEYFILQTNSSCTISLLHFIRISVQMLKNNVYNSVYAISLID